MRTDRPTTVDAPGWRRLRLVLLGAWLVVLVSTLLLGQPATASSVWSSSVRGLRVPDWVAGLALLRGLATLWHIVKGPQPWRATRCAWFWLPGSPLGLLAFLLLSGPMPGVRSPRRLERRLHGGWAFLIGCATVPVLGAGSHFGWI